MTNITSITASPKVIKTQAHSNEARYTKSNVVNIRSARKAQLQAQQELLDYMTWTMKHEMDPHRLYDDPIELFRAEMKASLCVA